MLQGSAVSYMLDQGIAHCDLNVNNIFFKLNKGQAHYLVSDFGLCHSLALEPDYDECKTTRYFEPWCWERRAVDITGTLLPYHPITLTVYTFAVIMINCLKLPGIEFPYSLEQSKYKR